MLLTAAAVALAAALGVIGALHHYRPGVVMGDARAYYLPYARDFLERGLAVLADPKSLKLAPLSYLYPALLGADPGRIQLVNVALYAALFVPVYRTGRLLHSRAAGLLAAFGFAALDEYQRWVPTVYTEAPFVALLVLWAWAVTEVLVARRRWAVPLAGVLLGLAILTRGTMLYDAVALAAVALPLAWRGPARCRAKSRDLAVMALVALLFPAAVIAKNLLLFGYGGLYTGVGLALYFGSHPLSGGLDPRWALGMMYDSNAVLLDMPRLGIPGDALLKGVALQMLADRGPVGLAAHWGTGAARVLFGSGTDAGLQTAWFNPRSFRIGGLVLALFALPALRSRAAGWVLGGTVAYLAAVHTPLLYLPRYVMPLDVFLIPLAAAGLARALSGLWEGGRPRRAAVAVLAVAAVLVAAGEWHRRTAPFPAPDILHVPRVALARVPAGAPEVGRGTVPVPPGEEGIPAAVAYVVPLRGVVSERRALHHRTPSVTSLRLTLSPPVTGRCDRARLMFHPAGDRGLNRDAAAVFPVRADGRPHRYDVGTYRLDIHGDGSLLLLLNCGPETGTELGDVTVWEDRVAAQARARYLARHPEADPRPAEAIRRSPPAPPPGPPPRPSSAP
jgi:hypothetical protein